MAVWGGREKSLALLSNDKKKKRKKKHDKEDEKQNSCKHRVTLYSVHGLITRICTFERSQIGTDLYSGHNKYNTCMYTFGECVTLYNSIQQRKNHTICY